MLQTVQTDEEFKSALLHCVDDLYRYAWSICHDSTNAEDLVSETVLKALENKNKLKDQSKLKPWMLRMLTNNYIDQRRKANRVKYISLDSTDDEAEPFSLYQSLVHGNLTDHATPEMELLHKISDESIQHAIKQLPHTFRIAFVLCDIEELSYQEIATTLDIKVGTVRSRIARARSILQRTLYRQAKEAGIKTKTTTGKKNIKCDC